MQGKRQVKSKEHYPYARFLVKTCAATRKWRRWQSSATQRMDLRKPPTRASGEIYQRQLIQLKIAGAFDVADRRELKNG